MTRRFVTLALLSILMRPDSGQAQLCREWEAVKTVGKIDRKTVPEASGLTYSRRFPGEVFWLNDSGNKAELILSSADGSGWRKIAIEGVRLRDSEALTGTECADGEACLIVGDVGDNNRKRETGHLIVIREADIQNGKVKPLHAVKFKYPDGAQDVEAMAALPNGDLLLMAKRFTLMGSLPAEVYSLNKADWQTPGDVPVTAKKLGELPIPDWFPDKAFLATAVTDAAVNSKRGVLGILTYNDLIEIPLTKLNDLAHAKSWKEGRDFAKAPIQSLAQQETLTYLPKDDRVLWSSEWFSPETPIFSMTCRKAQP